MTDSLGPAIDERRTVDRLFGSGDLDRLFGHHPQVVAPWPRAPRSKALPAFDRDEIRRLLRTPVDLEEVDPRGLWASQPWVLRRHADHYLTQTWERTGRTSADAHVELNRFPVIFVDHRQRSVIIAGHHRATAALVQGRPLLVRRAAESTPHAVTPLLWCDPDTDPIDAPDAAHRIMSGQRTTVPDTEKAERVLVALGEAGGTRFDVTEVAATIAAFESRRRSGFRGVAQQAELATGQSTDRSANLRFHPISFDVGPDGIRLLEPAKPGDPISNRRMRIE